MALSIVATETAKWIACGQDTVRENSLMTLDVMTLKTQEHRLVRRPQCSCCGVPRDAARPTVPVVIRSRKKQFTGDGGHRIATPEQTITQYDHHVSPITGAVPALSRIVTDAAPSVHVYAAGHNLAVWPDIQYPLRDGFRSRSAGKGLTDAQAKASGLCEALERYSGCFHGDEPRETTSYSRLAPRAIHPNACMLFSEGQYRHRDEWNARGSRFQTIPKPFDDEAEIEWTPVWSLTNREPRYVPTSYLYYGYPLRQDAFFCWADSNGNAAGNALEEAILQGFLELVERDSVAIWWYNRVRRPSVDLDGFDDPYIQQLRHQYRQLNRDVWVLNLTTDLAIPAFAAISRRRDEPLEQIILGFGAHLDPRIGISRALSELNQSAAFVHGAGASLESAHADADAHDWLTTATLASQMYLAPDDGMPLTGADWAKNWSDDLCEDVARCQQLVERHGMEMLVLDQTRPDIELPVTKVIVPGLRHFWARFAPGRLYDVPVKLGWLEQPLTEDQLNPIPVFF
jgi:ribosomal protein S12 methylthiotransferase accessory factor